MTETKLERWKLLPSSVWVYTVCYQVTDLGGRGCLDLQ